MDKIDLNLIRKQITELDETLLKLLAQRRQLSLQVVKSKIQDLKPVRDHYRESLLLENLVEKGRKLDLSGDYIHRVYRNIIEDSVELQQDFLLKLDNPKLKNGQYKIAYLGSPGSYSYNAVDKYLTSINGELIDVGCKTFDEIFAAVENKQAEIGLLPIENTSSGSINEVYDLLQTTRLKIIDEVYIPVRHSLLGKPGSKIEDIHTIYAHHQPIAQCSEFLASLPGVKLKNMDSTSSALAYVSQLEDPNVAVLGSIEAGKVHQLTPLQNNIANQKINQTRFIVVAKEGIQVPLGCAAKTSLVISVGQRPGALVDALAILKDHQINMCKIESRPIQGKPWEEMFYIDVTENLRKEKLQNALQVLKANVHHYSELGCYVRRSIPEEA
ncbi:chorismate mutase [Gayadomonas joobiniege]|uniref:chorismate mutase n=1 Tax=Gayadomonas joobiniege TaxID=1234606 RepID=UPI000363DACE|nr:chorismate mutase [Gayadomonas joobiniege]